MSMSRGTGRDGFGPPGCRDIRHLLGVYVLGAIDPAERPVVDGHLAGCRACRDELAGLAPLPAMLSRVPAADVEQISRAPAAARGAPPPRQLLDSLLGRVAARRRSRLRRGVLGIAAAALVAAGGTAAAVELAQPASRPVAAAGAEVARAASSATGVRAVVDYAATPWDGITMRVQVSGLPSGTTCDFYVVGTDGRAYAGEWTVQGSYGDRAWYPAASPAPAGSVRGFQLTTTGGKLLVSIPAGHGR